VVLLVGTGAAKTATAAARLAGVLDGPVAVLGIAPGERLEAALRRACVPFGGIARPAFAAED
jgi:hypothetical protein